MIGNPLSEYVHRDDIGTVMEVFQRISPYSWDVKKAERKRSWLYVEDKGFKQNNRSKEFLLVRWRSNLLRRNGITGGPIGHKVSVV